MATNLAIDDKLLAEALQADNPSITSGTRTLK